MILRYIYLYLHCSCLHDCLLPGLTLLLTVSSHPDLTLLVGEGRGGQRKGEREEGEEGGRGGRGVKEGWREGGKGGMEGGRERRDGGELINHCENHHLGTHFIP